MARSFSSLFQAIEGLSRFFKFSELTWNRAPLVERSPFFPSLEFRFRNRAPFSPGPESHFWAESRLLWQNGALVQDGAPFQC